MDIQDVENIQLKPVIINKKSTFVVITYWWGRGNINKNLQTPCPYQIDDALKKGVSLSIKKQGKSYEEMIDDWIDNMEKRNLNYLVAEYPMFAVKGGYQNAINYKPYFIEEALRACYPRSVLYIDGDMAIKSYPRILDTPGIDFAARSWSIDIDGLERLCYDPYVFETSGGTLFFGQTKFGYQLLKMWQDAMKKHKGKAEDRVISLIFNNKKMMRDLSMIQLPIEYLWLNLLYEKKKSIKKHRPRPIITHPYCITSEEAAIEQTDELRMSKKNRTPLRYEYYVENRVTCDRVQDTIYEYIAYKDKKTAKQDESFMKWLKKNGRHIVPYDNRYGEFNSVASINHKKMKTIKRISDNNLIIVSNTSNTSKYNNTHNTHKINHKDMLIPTILFYLLHGQSVIYVPSSFSSSLSPILKRIEKGYHLIAKNKSKSEQHFKKGYMLRLDQTYPIYFSSENSVLIDLIMMSENLQMISEHFNSSSTFLSRIRCNWFL